jgi:hypothetical protein
LPSAVKVILNLVPPGVEAVKDCPLKKVDLMSPGAIASAAKAALPVRSMDKRANGPVRISKLFGRTDAARAPQAATLPHRRAA